MANAISRREVLAGFGASGLLLSQTARAFTAPAPVAPVAVARCKTYEPAELTSILDGMFDKLGGLGRLVQGKTVAIKLNFNGGPTVRLGHLPLGDTHWPHPNLLAATMHLMARAGAHRIRLVEGAAAPRTDPFEEHMLDANWDPRQFLRAAPRVEFENTNYTNAAKKFTRLPVPHGGLLFPAYDVNHSYVDCDVFVTVAKYKDHPTTGVSTVMKNLFGLTPLTGLRQRSRQVGGQRPGLWQRPHPDPAPRIATTGHGRPARDRSDVAARRWLPRAPHYRRPDGCPAGAPGHHGRRQDHGRRADTRPLVHAR
jgi:hypothetical protein